MSEDKKKREEQVQKRVIREMKNDSNIMSYFEPYKKDSVDEFIARYVEVKATLEVYGDFTKYRQENIIKDYHEGAWLALKEIQFKKLFDLECEWRAEKVTDIPGIKISRDFHRVSKNVLMYEDISPISSTDIQFYQQFLSQKQDQIIYTLSYLPYHDYEDIKNNYDKESETKNEYFNFHNLHTGNDGLLLLPDIRGMKELKYLDIARDDSLSNTKPTKTKEKAQKFKKRTLSSFDDELIKFGEHFGDKKTINFIKDRWTWITEKPDLIFSWAFEYLRDIAPEKVPIEANDDWKESLYYAVVHHRNEKISDLLPSVYEEYLMKKDMGMLQADEKVRGEFDLSEIFKKNILKGRALLGEPRDFNF